MVGSVENTRIRINIGAVAVKIDLVRKKGIIINVRVVLVFVTKTRIIIGVAAVKIDLVRKRRNIIGKSAW